MVKQFTLQVDHDTLPDRLQLYPLNILQSQRHRLKQPNSQRRDQQALEVGVLDVNVQRSLQQDRPVQRQQSGPGQKEKAKQKRPLVRFQQGKQSGESLSRIDCLFLRVDLFVLV